MTKRKIKKFNNELDRKLPPVKALSLAASDEDIKESVKEMRKLQMQTIDKLFVYYGIKKDLFTCWSKLAWRLAEDFVPAMQFQKKRGQPKKWDMKTRMALHALIFLYKDKNPDTTLVEAYEAIRCQTDDTILSNIIMKATSKKTVQNEYERFQSGVEHKVIQAFEAKASKADQIAFYKSLLAGEI